MKKKILNYFLKIDICIYIILIFCILGLFRNLTLFKYFNFNFSYFNTKLVFAMVMIYFSQIVLILLRQRIAAFVSLIQVIFCIFVYKDFTFLQIADFCISLKNRFFVDISYGWDYFFSFALVSFLLSLELIKTYLLYTLTDQLPTRRKKK